jgi:phosphoglycerate dehydrogenase-like enzyme
MTVLACHRTAANARAQPEADGVVAPVQRFAPDQLGEMVSLADVLVFAVPETVETTGMVTRSVLESMRPGSIFVNVGRGSLVDETALIELLRSGHLGAAILDVSSREPMPADDPLWDAPNLYYSPHCAVSIGKMFEHLYELFEENLRRFLSGEDLLNRVVPGTGY